MRKICLATSVLLFFSSCAKFQQKWDQAQNETEIPHKTIEGPWVGSWKSTPSGHDGKLKCIIKETETGEFEFYYWATWANILSGGFKITCAVKKKDNAWSFSGNKDLGTLGGKFTHSGIATQNKLEATYRSDRGDHGSFKLIRPDKE